jgi:uncharacterized protein (DUF427 family)
VDIAASCRQGQAERLTGGEPASTRRSFRILRRVDRAKKMEGLGREPGFPTMSSERRPMQAIWNGAVIAESDDTVNVEGNYYFPLESVGAGTLTGTKTHTLCPWKGIASYYDVTIRGTINHNAAWTYRHPSPFARRVKNRVAFWKGVQVGPAPGGNPASRAARLGERA